jgi:phage tail tape-measure protein
VSGGGATAVVGSPGPPPTLEQRVERLENDLHALAEQAVKDPDEMHQLANEAKRRADEVGRELRALIENERREGLADALLLQKIGTTAFIVGVGLSVWGNLASC